MLSATGGPNTTRAEHNRNGAKSEEYLRGGVKPSSILHKSIPTSPINRTAHRKTPTAAPRLVRRIIEIRAQAVIVKGIARISIVLASDPTFAYGFQIPAKMSTVSESAPAEDLTFDNIDFLCRHRLETRNDKNQKGDLPVAPTLAQMSHAD